MSLLQWLPVLWLPNRPDDSVFRIFPIDLINTGLSGVILLAASVVLRLTILRPWLKVSYDGSSEDLVRWAENTNGKYQLWLRLRVVNKGLMKLTNPRVFCMDIVTRVHEARLNDSPTPFELTWAEAAGGGLSVLLPGGNFLHRFDLAFLTWATGTSLGALQRDTVTKFNLSRRGPNHGRSLQVGVEHEFFLLITNDNFLVPMHYVQLKLRIDVLNPKTVPHESGLQVSVTALSQGEYWLKRGLKFPAWLFSLIDVP